MPVRKKRRQSLNTKYDRLLESGHSPRSDSSSYQLTPSLIPTQVQFEANHNRLVKDRSRDRDRLWLDLGMEQEQPQAPCLDSLKLSTFANSDAEGWMPETPVTASQKEIQSRSPEPHEKQPHCHLPHSYLDSHEDEWPLVTDSPPQAVDLAMPHDVPTCTTLSPIQLLWTPQGVLSCSGAPVQWFYSPDMCVPLPSDAVQLAHTSSFPSGQASATTRGLHALDAGLMETSEHRSDLRNLDEGADELYDSASHLRASLVPEPPPARAGRDDSPDSRASLSTVEDQVHWEPPFSIDDLDVTDSASETNEQVDPESKAEVDNALAAYGYSSPATNFLSTVDPIEDKSITQKAESESAEIQEGAITSATVSAPRLYNGTQDSKQRKVQANCASSNNSMEVEPALHTRTDPCFEPMFDRNVDRRQYLSTNLKRSLKSRLTTDEPRALAPPAARSRGAKHTSLSSAPAPHTPVSTFGERPQPPSLHAPDRRSLDSVEHVQRTLSQSSGFKTRLPTSRNASIQTIPEIPTQSSDCTVAKKDIGTQDQSFRKSSGDTEEATTMAAEVLTNGSGLQIHQANGGGNPVTLTLPPESTTTPYHKPGLHTLSQTIFKRRPEVWANLTYQQQPGTNSLDPKTPAPPTPTIAPVDVWLSVGETSEIDKRLESIGEVPELEDIEVDAASEPEEAQQGETEEIESIRSFTPSQEQPRIRKKKKQVRFNLEHEEFPYEPDPDPRRIIGLLKHHPSGERLDVGYGTAVFEIGAGTRRASPGAGVAPEQSPDSNEQDTSSKTVQELETQEDKKPGASYSPDPETNGDSKSDIGFTIYRDGY